MNLPAQTQDSNRLTVEQLREHMPPRQRTNINQGLVDTLNQVMDEPEFRDQFRENLLGWADALQDPNTTMPGYIAAVKYVSFKMMGFTNEAAWIKTFPERHKRLIEEDKPAAHLRGLVSAYNKGKLVTQLMRQSIIPTWILNYDKFQHAVNVQATIMTDSSVSPKVRSDAANSLLTHLKQPEAKDVNIAVEVKQDETITKLSEAMAALAEKQRQAIEDGVMTAEEVAEAMIIEGESERLD